MKSSDHIRPARGAANWEDPHAKRGASGEFVTRGIAGSGGVPTGLLSVMLRLAETERLVRPFAQSGIVYACVQTRAKLLAEARPVVWESDEDEADEVETKDPLRMLLRRPNALGGGLKFWRMISQHFDLAGGTFLFMTSGKTDAPIRPGEVPGAVWPVREDHVEILLDENNRPKTYQFDAAGKRVSFPEHAVAHLYDADPDNPMRGIGPMQAAFRVANNLFKAEAFDDALVENGGQIGGIITPLEGELTDAQAQELQESLHQEHLTPKKSGRYAVIPKGVKVEQTAFSPRDMQAKDLRVLGRNHEMMIFGVTPPLLGIVEDVNRANGSEARRVFYESHGIPTLKFLADEFEAHVLPKIGYEGHAFSFDVSGIAGLREDAAAIQARVRGWIDIGRSFREAIAIEHVEIDGLDEMEGVDDRYRAQGLVPVEQDALEDEDELPPSPVAEAPVDAAFRTAREAIDAARQRRIGAVAEIEKRLAPRDRAITRAIARVFKSFVKTQQEKIRAVAAQSGGVASAIVPWNDFPAMSPSTRAWSEALDLELPRRWREVRGISQAELADLLISADKKWRDQLWGAADKQLRLTIDEAASTIASEIGASLQIDATSPAMLRYLASKELLLKEGPMSVVAEQVRHAIVEALADSSSVGTLADRVREVLESLDDELEALADRLGTRAAMIARTETAGASNAARFEQMRTAGIAQHEWASAGDEIVRDAHQIDGETTIIGEPFSNGMRHPHEPGAPAELVVNCLPGDQRVAGAVIAASKAWYSGAMVEIETEHGHRLTVTINHPVLTSRGFVRAGALREGDNVLCEPLDVHRRSARWDVQDKDSPPTIEQVFDSIAAQGSSLRSVPGRRDFYGDARFFKGEVEVVTLAPRPESVHDTVCLNGELRNERQAVQLTENGEKLDLVLPNLAGMLRAAAMRAAAPCSPRGAHLSSHSVGVASARAPLQRLRGAGASRSDSCVAQDAQDHAARHPMLLRERQHAGAALEFGEDRSNVNGRSVLRLGATADLHPTILGPVGNGGGLHAELATKMVRGYPGRVAPDRIVALRIRDFDGPVFDLHTAQGYFAAGENATAIVRNCRCAAIPVVPVESEQESLMPKHQGAMPW